MSHADITCFDASEYLDSDEMIAEYLNAALDENDAAIFLSAVADVAKAKGMTQVALAAGLGRESLYKALAPNAQPRFFTILRVMHALGVTFSAVPNRTAHR
ncbi:MULTISPECIES: addiction module antidote protein [Pandoraea]|uniref:Addiction module antitoxin n=1 Tax=Pandoraea communis TaxID=2508297 RepID=A0A5E4T5E7_9BURK|nr:MULTISPECIES: addiction module antidote protein [Pandoraea]EON11746.1 addiction module antidote protein [Pandoraea sp. SD6-2]MDM8355032.1 putative addiction module antidote protein [Pandoraea communis]VVD83055.1 addiction module antitoxin [Pandoraea communis]